MKSEFSELAVKLSLICYKFSSTKLTLFSLDTKWVQNGIYDDANSCLDKSESLCWIFLLV